MDHAGQRGGFAGVLLPGHQRCVPDPVRPVFPRFLNKERMALHKLPDIDIDFPHDRKDDVVNLSCAKYGAAHCAVVGGFSTFQARSAFGGCRQGAGHGRSIEVRRFTERISRGGLAAAGCRTNRRRPAARGWSSACKARPEMRGPAADEEPYRTALEMAEFLDGFPRYPEDAPLRRRALRGSRCTDLTPTFHQPEGLADHALDMDAVEAIGLVKMDILAQGGLAVMRDACASRWPRAGCADRPRRRCEPWEDPAVWEMIASGDARAVHHIESPAMINLCRHDERAGNRRPDRHCQRDPARGGERIRRNSGSPGAIRGWSR